MTLLTALVFLPFMLWLGGDKEKDEEEDKGSYHFKSR